MFDRKSVDKQRHVTKKDVFTDEIMRKGHVHAKDHKTLRTNQRQRLHQIDLENYEDFDDDELMS